MSALSVKTLLASMEDRFYKLTLAQLCETARRARFTKEELTNVDGVIYRATVINILKRRYIFGIIAALFKPLNSNVFECIAKFVDFDIEWQARIHEYVYSAYFIYKNRHVCAIAERNASNALFLGPQVLSVRYAGRKSHIMMWITKSHHHQLAYYQFKKEQNITDYEQRNIIEEKEKEAKLAFWRTGDRAKYNEFQEMSTRMLNDLTDMYIKQEHDWMYKYAWTNFPTSTELLYTYPENLDN